MSAAPALRAGLNVAPFGELADLRALAAIAGDAEDAGWDAVFVWDHTMTHGATDVADPWMALTAIALATSRVRIGAMVTPLPRRRPWDLARQVAVLDRLSGGRVIFGGGLGGDGRRELSAFGEEPDARRRAALLDESLELLLAFWHGEPVTRAGGAYPLDAALVLPTPLQRPRPPVWMAARWPNMAPVRRAARYDGLFPVSTDAPLGPGEVRALLATVAEHRDAGAGPFDLVLVTDAERIDAARAGELAAAGATWWLQGFGDRPALADVRAAARSGPPQWAR